MKAWIFGTKPAEEKETPPHNTSKDLHSNTPEEQKK